MGRNLFIFMLGLSLGCGPSGTSTETATPEASTEAGGTQTPTELSATTPTAGSGAATATPTEISSDDRCAVIRASISSAGFAEDVSIECDGDHAWFASDTYPDHTLMTGILGTNLQVPVPALDHVIPIPLAPALADSITTIDNAVAVAINGVPIYDYSSQGTIEPGEYDASVDTVALGELDVCSGHSGRGDDYHYHAAPNCMLESIDGLADDTIIGWAFDGYPLFGNRNPDGSEISDGDLDVCNSQADGTFGRRYHTSDAPPYIVQCLVGEVDLNLHRPIAPLEDSGGEVRALGRLPSGGEPVENLVYTEQESGERVMTFSQDGTDMSISYQPSGTEGCYDFVMVNLEADPSTGTWCR